MNRDVSGACCSLAWLIIGLLLGLSLGQEASIRHKLLTISSCAVGLVAVGDWLYSYGQALGTGDPALAGLPYAILGSAAQTVGLLLGATAGIGATTFSARRQHHGWLIALVGGTLIPLFVTIMVSEVLALGPFAFGQNADAASILDALVHVLALGVPLVPFGYSVWLRMRPHEDPVPAESR